MFLREDGAVEKKRQRALRTIDFISLFHRQGEGVCSGVCSKGQQPLFIRIGTAAHNGDTFAIGQQAILSSLQGDRESVLCFGMEFDPKIFKGIRRNAPCPCNSGRKFKRCHGSLQAEDAVEIPPHIVDLMKKRNEAAEMLRKKQQGYGRPIITAEVDGIRFVQVGTTLAYSRKWGYFPDFLLDNMKRVMTPAWGSDASKNMPHHPVIRWLRQLNDARKSIGAGQPLKTRGGTAALNRFAYALYLIEHNDKPQNNLIARLRKANDFDAACYETLVESAFAVAGAAVEGAEEVQGDNRKPEFIATFPDGRKYAVEAKRKNGWRNGFDVGNSDFQRELRKWIRGMLHNASAKKLPNPVYWFELGIPDLTANHVSQLHDLIVTAIDDAEDLTVKDKLTGEIEPAQAAYVVVTNYPEFASDDAERWSQFAVLHGFRMEDMRDGVIDLETAMERHDKHRPVRRVLEAMLEVQTVPNSFAGLPDELLDRSGTPIETLGLGQQIVYPTEDDEEAIGTIEEITAMDDKAWVVVHDEKSGKRVIVTVPLTLQEQAAVAKHGNAIFGKPEGPHENITDPLRFYDRMLEVFSDYNHEHLMNQVQGHPQRDVLAKLSRDELYVRVAREMTKSMVWRARQRSAGPPSKDDPATP